MAPPRTYDLELLKRLVRNHPDWSYHEYARVLTDDMRARTGDPRYPVILPNTVAAAISRYRDRWREDGIRVDDNRMPVYRELIPARWRVSPAHKMDTPLKHLRTIARLRRGLGASQMDARQALAFERRLRERREVVDVTPNGRPVIRPAAHWELDGKGELIEIVAQPAPGQLRQVGVPELVFSDRD